MALLSEDWKSGGVYSARLSFAPHRHCWDYTKNTHTKHVSYNWEKTKEHCALKNLSSTKTATWTTKDAKKKQQQHRISDAMENRPFAPELTGIEKETSVRANGFNWTLILIPSLILAAQMYMIFGSGKYDEIAPKSLVNIVTIQVCLCVTPLSCKIQFFWWCVCARVRRINKSRYETNFICNAKFYTHNNHRKWFNAKIHGMN